MTGKFPTPPGDTTKEQILIVFSHLPWDFVWQRPQHLISRLARRRPTWFVEEPRAGDVSSPVLKTQPSGNLTRVWLEIPAEPNRHYSFNHPLASRLPSDLSTLFGESDSSTERLVWLYTPMALPLARQLQPSLLIYDVMDDLSAFKNPPEGLAELHDEALSAADIVFTGGRSLYGKVSEKRKAATYLFASGVDPDHYAPAKTVSEKRRHEDRRPVAGYIGVIDERLDLDSIGALARSLPDWDIQMVGPVLKIDPASLPREPNLHYLGQQPYEELPRILGGFDVALMPFVLNEATRSISPTKTLEYLAAGLPVVSTRIPDVMADYGTTVDFQDDAAGFAAACRKLRLDSREEREAKVGALLKLHNWDFIASRMDELIGDALTEGRHRAVAVKAPARRPFDFLIVGAGYAGSVLAERLASEAGKRVLIVEKRNHIGGNAYDCYDDAGILIHKYGPHIFHTNSAEVFDYLSKFTAWRQYEHRVLASVDGMHVPMPINLETVNRLYGLNLNCLQLEEFFQSLAEPVAECKTSEDVVVGRVGRELYEKFFRNYTRKQWGLDPSELEAQVTARVPVRTNRDSRYFTDRFQAMPAHGYTRMFERMLAHANIKIMLNTDYHEVADLIAFKEMIFTGPIDEYFDFCYGKLPYRSLDFQFETHDTERLQEAAVINYPNEHAYTRVTEFKYLTGQVHPKTTIVFEHPRATGDPYYPVPRPENARLYKKYKALAETTPRVHFVGRLATYKYYNMDQVVAQSLSLAQRLISAARAGAVPGKAVAAGRPPERNQHPAHAARLAASRHSS